MPGPGRPLCLDVTRLVSRVGAGPATGIDRVERAWLVGLLERDPGVRGLARTAWGFVLLDAAGLADLAARLDDGSWGPPDLAARLSLRLAAGRRAAEATLRRNAIARVGRRRLAESLARHLPAGSVYLNVGHSNLDDAVLGAVRAVTGATILVLVHDTIPIRLPGSQRPGATARFAARLAAVARHADRVICTSQAEAIHVAEALARAGAAPPITVAPLGIDRVTPDMAALDALGLPDAPLFTAVGTMEPRKNLGLLLDLWERLAADPPAAGVPTLALVGRRGWETPAFFARLDALQARLPQVREMNDLSDGARAAVLARSRALLFPSRAEGYGLPPLEALALGVRPVCAPLDVYAETLGDSAVYADPDDLYHWERIVRTMAADGAGETGGTGRHGQPDWSDHLNLALSTIA